MNDLELADLHDEEHEMVETEPEPLPPAEPVPQLGFVGVGYSKPIWDRGTHNRFMDMLLAGE